MPLAPGTRLGPYEILAPIGAGGMGEVYRALDTKLKRDVALKVLPEAFAQDPDRMLRFQREAEVLASLNHTNIAHIYGVEDRALIMELAEGESPKGPMSFDEAWRVASQIAAALQYAHDKGIVHRDLKPANIKVTPEGIVKLLDFGLAKAFTNQREATTSTVENSPTLTIGATEVGVILGTAAYMAPEQAKGKSIDKRADIWSFGVVLYELLTGERLFQGEDVSETLSQVLTKQPDWEKAPPQVRRLLKSCLQKDPKLRLHDIADAKLLLEDEAAVVETPASLRSRFRTGGWAAAGVFLALAAAISFVHFRESPPAAGEPTRFQIALPVASTGVEFYMAFSPDGRKLAFTEPGKDGLNRLWVRSLEALDSRMLGGTEGAVSPFWSPDSREIGFGEGSRLKKVDASGVSPPIVLCQVGTSVGTGTWNKDGVILFGQRQSGPLRKVSASGGTPTEVTALAAGEIWHSLPVFLPDGRHFLYLRGGNVETTGIYAGSLDAKPTEQNKHVLTTTLAATFVPSPKMSGQDGGGGHLMYLRGTTLMAQPFDTSRLELSGDPAPIAEHLGISASHGYFTASASGALAYRTGAGAESQLTWYDRKGKALGTAGNPGSYTEVALSPDGSRVATQRTDGQDDIWLFDFARGAETRFTFDPAVEQNPVWSPDNQQIIFVSGRTELYRKAANGASEAQLLVKSPDRIAPQDWSRDGRYLLYATNREKTGWDLWVLPLEGERKPTPVLATPFSEIQARFSPDPPGGSKAGPRWIVYSSNESGPFQIYVRPFVAPGSSSVGGASGKWMVSNAGGVQPRWRSDGKEILYISPAGELMSVAVTSSGDSFQAGVPQELFEVPLSGGPSFGVLTAYWDMTADGQKFLLNSSVTESASPVITVVLNWQAGLKK
jgi:eukaryotic-like serine/threonine-protein kinase